MAVCYSVVGLSGQCMELEMPLERLGLKCGTRKFMESNLLYTQFISYLYIVLILVLYSCYFYLYIYIFTSIYDT